MQTQELNSLSNSDDCASTSLSYRTKASKALSVAAEFAKLSCAMLLFALVWVSAERRWRQ